MPTYPIMLFVGRWSLVTVGHWFSHGDVTDLLVGLYLSFVTDSPLFTSYVVS